jgi:hypothetical protein
LETRQTVYERLGCAKTAALTILAGFSRCYDQSREDCRKEEEHDDDVHKQAGDSDMQVSLMDLKAEKAALTDEEALLLP